MQDEFFKFIAGPTPRSLRIEFRGFWGDYAVQSYIDALLQRKATTGGASTIDRVLLDMRGCSVQSQAVMESIAKILQGYAGQIRHYGILLPDSALLALQMKRLLPDSSDIFDNDEDASRWLAL